MAAVAQDEGDILEGRFTQKSTGFCLVLVLPGMRRLCICNRSSLAGLATGGSKDPSLGPGPKGSPGNTPRTKATKAYMGPTVPPLLFCLFRVGRVISVLGLSVN